jgi:hypothetical protein
MSALRVLLWFSPGWRSYFSSFGDVALGSTDFLFCFRLMKPYKFHLRNFSDNRPYEYGIGPFAQPCAGIGGWVGGHREALQKPRIPLRDIHLAELVVAKVLSRWRSTARINVLRVFETG